MTNQQILEKAIQKAIDGGWTPLKGVNTNLLEFEISENKTRIIWRYNHVTSLEKWSVYGTIFNHDFAKALWPGNMPTGVNLPNWAEPTPAWESHLQNMVIAEDPIKYLGDHL